MTPGQKPFNAINGLEALELVMADIKNLLSRDGRFRQNLTYHQLSFAVAVQIRTFPTDAGSFEAEAQGRVSAPGYVGQLAIPAVPVIGAPAEQTHLREVPRPQQDRRTGEMFDGPTALEQVQVHAREQAERTSIGDDAFEAELRRRGLTAVTIDPGAADTAGVDESIATGVVSEEDARPNPKTLSEAPRTAFGDVITGGAKEPDGAVLEMGARHRRAHEETQKLERQRANLGMEDTSVATSTRTVDNPNAARREANLPVPEPRREGGQVFDVARDQF